MGDFGKLILYGFQIASMFNVLLLHVYIIFCLLIYAIALFVLIMLQYIAETVILWYRNYLFTDSKMTGRGRLWILLLVLHLALRDAAAMKPRIESAIFTCGYALLPPEEIALLFPPSDISMGSVHNVTAAEHIHRRGITSFCKQVETYTACVNENLFHLPDDELVKLYMDVNNFDRYFKFYCKNSKLIENQFQCTRMLLWRRKCPLGGVYGIIAQVSQMIRQPLSKDEFCLNMKLSINCRVRNQLEPCDEKFAGIMKWIYEGLVGSYCQHSVQRLISLDQLLSENKRN